VEDHLGCEDRYRLSIHAVITDAVGEVLLLEATYAPRRLKGWVVLALTAVLFLACQRTDIHPAQASREAPIVPLDTGTVRVGTATDTFYLSVEIAETVEQKGIGLMDRPFLPADEGMLFVYEDEQLASAGFYMFRTLIPLDIAFLDAAGRVVAIRRMEPCAKPVAAWCERYPPGVAYRAALEVNAGVLAGRGVGIGDRIERVERARR
jgi:uncharacterized protein